MADLYSSTPLLNKRRSIRVLKVHGTNEEKSQAVSGELQVIDLDDEHAPFAALTYVWNIDEDETKIPLKCGDQSLPLTRNGYDALKHLRNKLGAFNIWIDAVCIDQANNNEKISQIKLMGDIYSEAETVYIWLGVSNDACSRAMRYIQRNEFQRHFRWEEESARHNISKYQKGRAAFSYAFGKMGSITKTSRRKEWKYRNWSLKWPLRQPKISFDDLDALLNNPWITRMWTFQEILLASNPVVVVGESHLPWTLFERAMIFLHYSGTCRKSAPHLQAFLETWIELILGRDQLATASAASCNASALVRNDPDEDIEDIHKTQLLLYRDFVVEVSETVNWTRNSAMEIVKICFIIFFFAGLADGIAFAFRPSKNGNSLVDQTFQVMVEIFNKTAEQITTTLQTCEDLHGEGCLSKYYSTGDALANATSAFQGFVLTYNIETGGWSDPLWEIAVPTLMGILMLTAILSICILLLLRRRTAGPMYLTGESTVSLVKGLCMRKCRDAKDIPLAMLAILKRLSGCDIGIIHASETLPHAYMEFSKKMIDGTKSLDLLIPAAIQGFEDLPSWVPDWTATKDTFWINPPLFDGQPSDATPDSRGIFRWDGGDEKILVVRGLQQLDVIWHCYEFTEAPSTYDPKDDAIHLENLRKMRSFLRTDCTMQGYSQLQIMKALSATYMPDSRATTESHLISWLQLFYLVDWVGDESMLFSLLTKRHLKTKGRLALSVADKGGPFGLVTMCIFMLNKLENVWETHVMICNTLAQQHKILFSTKQRTAHLDMSLTDPRQRAHNRKRSAYTSKTFSNVVTTTTREKSVHLGVADKRIQRGDKIILVSGVRTPLITRTTVESRKLISPAMIPNLMSGRAWINPEESAQLQELRLH